MRRKRVFATVAGVIVTGLIVLAVVLFAPKLKVRLRPLTIRGAVLTQDPDPTKQIPIADARIQITAAQLQFTTKSDNSGYFTIVLPVGLRKGQPLQIQFEHPQYRPSEWSGPAGDRLYIGRLQPVTHAAEEPQPNQIKLDNIVVQYSISNSTAVNVGFAVKTFQVVNKGDVPCERQPPCSPDGAWKAAAVSEVLHASPGNEFHNARASCIAGPCPFTRIEEDNFAHDSETLRVTFLDWSDTATFLVEAEVYRTTAASFIRQSYPIIFERAFTFTLPAMAQGVNIEATLNGSMIVFPLGPALNLSWANCQTVVNRDGSRVYRCELKPGYRFS